MKTESNLCSFTQAKELKELGYKERVHWMYIDSDITKGRATKCEYKDRNTLPGTSKIIFSAPSVSSALQYLESKTSIIALGVAPKIVITRGSYKQVVYEPSYIINDEDGFKCIYLKHFNDLGSGLSALLTAILEYLKEKK